MAQEPISGERHDDFNSEQARLFKSIFGFWEDKFLDVVKPIAEKICSNDDKFSTNSVPFLDEFVVLLTLSTTIAYWLS